MRNLRHLLLALLALYGLLMEGLASEYGNNSLLIPLLFFTDRTFDSQIISQTSMTPLSSLSSIRSSLSRSLIPQQAKLSLFWAWLSIGSFRDEKCTETSFYDWQVPKHSHVITRSVLSACNHMKALSDLQVITWLQSAFSGCKGEIN